jgi:NAD(P)-dependent dehydrogenase (short-subunit alcohol dehydrogenase family)
MPRGAKIKKIGGFMARLKDRVAIVTGAGTGIGEVCAKQLAAEGAKLVVADIDDAGAERVAAEIRARGQEAFAIHVDISDEASVAALYAKVLERYGRVDVLHNNAATTTGEQIFRDAGIGEMDVAVWDRAFAVNTRGTMLMIKHAIKPMQAAGGGSIINTSSGASLAADYYAPAYGASKAAVNMLTQYVAMQYGKQNIRCNVISPGLIVTPTAAANNKNNEFAIYEANSMMPYLGRPEDIAAMVVFLASDDARYVTAQTMRVDGGYTAHMPHTAPLHDVFLSNPGRRPGG